ncbi:MAG: ComEC/Rec2 family competence protein [Methylomonas sp.]
MSLNCLTFLLGIVGTQHLAHLPDSWLLISFSTAAVCLAWRRDWPLAFLLAGIIWASWFGSWQLNQRLPESAFNQELVVEGYISNLPEQHSHRVSFDFVITSPSENFPKKIRLNWYNPEPTLAAGQNWRLNVKLKPPHGRSNPGGFDYEAWLFANRIGATGYVRSKPQPSRIDASRDLNRYFAVWRQSLADKIDQALPNGQQLGLIKALSLGNQNSISQAQWDVFRITGVIHLIVISGSHISLIAGLVYVGLRRSWAWLGILSVSPQQVAAGFAWLTGLFYAGLAGYTIPTLRAVMMLSVALATIVWQRNSSPLQILFLALFAVLIFDPLAVLAVGFWLSFLAVALLIYLSVGRLSFRQTWQQASLSQLATTIGLAPLLIALFQQVSLISPLANGLAVPLIGLLIVPLILLAMILLVVAPILAIPVLWLVDQLLQGFCCLADLSRSSRSRTGLP